jgi:hypothetical protein
MHHLISVKHGVWVQLILQERHNAKQITMGFPSGQPQSPEVPEQSRQTNNNTINIT